MIMISFGSVVEWVLGAFAVGFFTGLFTSAYLFEKWKHRKKS